MDTNVILKEGTRAELNMSRLAISYDRSQQICTGIGLFRLEATNLAIDQAALYDTFTVYEGGIKKGTYYIHTIDFNHPKGTITYSCQDASILLQNYFVAELYTIDTPSLSSYWISRFATEAKVTITYDNVDPNTASLLSNNTTLGHSPALEIITALLQQNNWYIYFDADNVGHVGTLAADSISILPLHGDDVLEISETMHDKMFRNRIVVWGGTTKSGDWIFVDLDKSGSYANEYPAGDTGYIDKRTVVISNGNIPSFYVANLLAGRALKEFSRTTDEIDFSMPGAYDITLGMTVGIDSDKFAGSGMVTTVGSSMDQNGLITHAILNQRCPRLFAYYKYGDKSYVYVGTAGMGVWRKTLDSSTWVDFSTGLPADDRWITDLAIQGDRLVCTTAQGFAYTAWSDGGWTKVTGSVPPGEAVFCTFDKSSYNAIVAYSPPASATTGESYIHYITTPTRHSGIMLVDENGFSNYTIVGIDNNGVDNIVCVTSLSGGSGESNNYLWNNTMLGYLNNNAQLNTTIFIDSGAVLNNDGNAVFTAGKQRYSFSVCGDGKYIFVSESVFIADEWLLSIRMMDTKPDADFPFGGSYVYGSEVLGYSHAEWVRAIGGKCAAFLYYGPGTDTSYYIRVMDYLTTTATIRDIRLTGIPGSDSRDIMAVNVFVVEDKVRYYFLMGEAGGNSVSLYYYDFFRNRVVHVGNSGAPGNFEGGNIIGLSTPNFGFALAITDNHIYAVVEALYEDVTYDGVFHPYVQFPVVFHCQILGTGHSSITSSTACGYHLASMGVGGWALEYNYDIASAAKEDDFYICMYADFYIDEIESSWTTFIFKWSSGISAGEVSSTGEGSPYEWLTGNKTTMYAVSDDNTVTNADTGTPVRILPGTISTVCQTMDDEAPGIITYSRATGDVTKHITMSGASGSVIYDLNLTPDYSSGYSGGDDHIALVFDSMYVQVETHKFPSRKLKHGLITPSGTLSGISLSGLYGEDFITTLSGERLFEADYSTFNPAGGEKLLRGFKGTYSTVMEVSMPHLVEISIPTVVAAWGNISYSGITISGTSTGYDYGQIYLSPKGYEDTYTRVVLNALEGAIPDLRTCQVFVEVSGLPILKNYCAFPQNNGSTSELTLVDVTNLTSTPGVIIASGSLSTGAILETFEGTALHLETTTSQDVPYFFVSMEGAPSTFWQKDGRSVEEPQTEFIDRTGNLPASQITCIRVDDRI